MSKKLLLSLFLLAAFFWKMHAQSLDSFQIVYDDSIRTYKVYIPSAYTGDEPWPLVISMHGFGQTNDFMIASTRMNEVADTAHFLVAYPQGLLVRAEFSIPPFPDEGTGFNLGQLDVSNNDDVGFIGQMIDEISTQYKIDSARVYACGNSNGGSMSYKLACELSDRIAAIASSSGGMVINQTCEPERSFPIMEIHGLNDPIVPFEGIPNFIKPIPETINFWANHNNCDANPVITALPDLVPSDSTTVNLKVYGNCDANSEVRIYEVVGGGHPWAGSYSIPPPFLGRKNEDIIASVEIWNFFKRFVHPNPLSTGTNTVHRLEGSLSLYPNPVNGLLNVDFQLDIKAKEIDIDIYNVLGFPVHMEKLGMYDKHLLKAINLQNLSAGIYLLRLKAGNQFITQKFIKAD